MAASSVGKWPRALMILRNCMFKLSIALVVQITRLMSGGNTKNGVTFSQARCQAATIVGYLVPQGPSANACGACSAACALAAA